MRAQGLNKLSPMGRKPREGQDGPQGEHLSPAPAPSSVPAPVQAAQARGVGPSIPLSAQGCSRSRVLSDGEVERVLLWKRYGGSLRESGCNRDRAQRPLGPKELHGVSGVLLLRNTALRLGCWREGDRQHSENRSVVGSGLCLM